MNTEGLNLTYEDFLLGKKRRRISNPSDDLKKYQRSKLKKLESIYFDLIKGTEIQNTAHGFISNRNCASCAHKHIGYEMTIMMDISKFFDTVTVQMIKNVSEEAASDKYLFHNDGYTAQGFPTSPVLCNIASIPMLNQINDFMKSLYGNNFAFTIYADDIQISINRIMKEIRREENLIINKIIDIAKQNNLTINKNKTRVRYAKYGFRRILGINVGSESIRLTRKTKRRIRAATHQNNYHSLGGLIAWSHCSLPKKMKIKIKEPEDK